jgi:hypothetical protein
MGKPCSLGDAKVLRESPSGKALLVECEDLGETKWVPKSCVHDDSPVFDANENSDGELIVEEWWATKEGLV